MKALFTIFFCLIVSACSQHKVDSEETTIPIVINKEKSNTTLADIAYDLLEFDRYKEALELVRDETSMTAVTVKIIANDRLGNPREAIDYAILDLRSKDTARFYEGSWELWDLYLIFKKDINYGLERLNDEYIRCRSNYQVRQLMMKLYWYLEDYEKVVALGDEFRKEFPDLPNEVTFNCWRQDALDSLNKINTFNGLISAANDIVHIKGHMNPNNLINNENTSLSFRISNEAGGFNNKISIKPFKISKDSDIGFADWVVEIESRGMEIQPLILHYYCLPKIVYEGDLDKDGMPDFGLFLQRHSSWSSYALISLIDERWVQLCDTFPLYHTLCDSGKEIARPGDKEGEINITMSSWEDELGPVVLDTIIVAQKSFIEVL